MKKINLTRALCSKAIALHSAALTGLITKAMKALDAAKFDEEVAETLAEYAACRREDAAENLRVTTVAVMQELKSLPNG